MTVSKDSSQASSDCQLWSTGLLICAIPLFAAFYLESLLITLIKAPFSSFSLWLSAFRSGNICEKKNKRKSFTSIKRYNVILNKFYVFTTRHMNKLCQLYKFLVARTYMKEKTWFVKLISLINDGIKSLFSQS